ncbi:MAG: FGGY family carbohydrate kinase, partial [Sphaerochaeta sp.]|nr:FGGY family carbohydrate kinase [Sphaerochaeta sp.]
MQENKTRQEILNGESILGIEFGSTRIKAVLINVHNEPIAQGGFDWENSLVNGIWTYSLENVWKGLSTSFKNLRADVQEKYGVNLTKIKALGISAMMHGYLAFDKDDNLLVPFRTWRNTITQKASEELSELFDYPVPERWSISHLYHAILSNEPHVKELSYVCTLAGYVHWQLTGEKVLGIGDASGMFPIDCNTQDYDQTLMGKFDALIEPYAFDWKLSSILPKVLFA